MAPSVEGALQTAERPTVPEARVSTHRKDPVRLVAPCGDGAEGGQHASNGRQRDATGAVLQGVERQGHTIRGGNTGVG
jgi:hypothetical protein